MTHSPSASHLLANQFSVLSPTGYRDSEHSSCEFNISPNVHMVGEAVLRFSGDRKETEPALPEVQMQAANAYIPNAEVIL